jgi:hypothetical protein
MADETERQAESLSIAGDQIEPVRTGNERTAAELAAHERGLVESLDPRGATGGTGAPRDQYLWNDPQRIRDENAHRNTARLENTVQTLMDKLRTLEVESERREAERNAPQVPARAEVNRGVVLMSQNTQELSLTTPVLFYGKTKDGKFPPNAFLMELVVVGRLHLNIWGRR